MPYLGDEKRRAELDEALEGIALHDGAELNYVVCRLLDQFIAQHGLSYHMLEEFLGGLECAKLEINRRIVGPYEDIKRDQNGDVFTHTAPLLEKTAAMLSGWRRTWWAGRL